MWESTYQILYSLHNECNILQCMKHSNMVTYNTIFLPKKICGPTTRGPKELGAPVHWTAWIPGFYATENVVVYMLFSLHIHNNIYGLFETHKYPSQSLPRKQKNTSSHIETTSKCWNKELIKKCKRQLISIISHHKQQRWRDLLVNNAILSKNNQRNLNKFTLI